MNDRTTRMEREVEAQRSEVEHTIEALKGRLSPGEILDQAMHAFSDAGGQGNRMASNLGRQIRDNPLSVALIGIGAAMLMGGGGRYGDGHGMGNGMAGAAHRAGASAEGAAERARHAASGAAASVSAGTRDTASAAAERARGAADQASHAARRTGAAISGQAAAAGSSASHAARDTYEGAMEYGERARRSAADFIVEQPLVAGALALAAGAAIGAALPSSRFEDETIGGMRDDLADEAMERAASAAEGARHVAERTYESAREEARREGLVPENDERTVAERAREVAKAAAGTAREETEREAGRREPEHQS